MNNFFKVESNYERWQLLTKPLTLDEFNGLPRLTCAFFDYGLRFLDQNIHTPTLIFEQTEINIWAWEVMHYKWKLYSVHDVSK